MLKVDSALYERLAALIQSMGFELVGCELSPQGRQMIFRIYIDSEQGVTVGNCSQVSHQVSAMLDVEQPTLGNYVLEVSSPGIDRPLFKIEHYFKYLGSRVKVRLYTPVDNRR